MYIIETCVYIYISIYLSLYLSLSLSLHTSPIFKLFFVLTTMNSSCVESAQGRSTKRIEQ